MLEIGNLKLQSNLILAPMAGVTDLPFRMLNRRFGCEFAFVEMINCRSISHKSKKTKSMLTSDGKDRPLGIQLLGLEPKFILKSMDVLKAYDFDLLDFNAACPAKKVTRRGEGASLLQEPKKLNELLKLVVKHAKEPVTVKIRTGWDKDSSKAEEIALYAQDAGINGLFIHGRTKFQEYSGQVDYESIRRVKKALNIPVIASGDCFSAQLVKKMFDETGCDAVAIARGALGNPWIFESAKTFLKTGKTPKMPEKAEIIRVMSEHLSATCDLYGEKAGVVIFRKFFAWYTKGFRSIRPLREKCSRIKAKQELVKVIEQCGTRSLV
jgi:tRNA-dihydrouridine synthase B